MGDPLSLAAGIVGLVSLTIRVLQVANKFKNDVKDVHEEITSLMEELAALNSVLELLKKAWENRRTPANFDLSALARIEATCEARLKDLLKTLLKGQVRLQKKSYTSFHGAMARIKWPLEADKTREITKTIHRYFCIFSWTLSCSDSDILHGLSNDVCKALKDQENTLDDVRELFRSFPDLRQHIDTGNFITTSVLQVVEAQSATLDDLARDMAKLDVTITKTAEVLDRVPDLEFKKENRDTLQRIEEKLARVEGQVAADRKEYLLRRKIFERYDDDQSAKSLPSIPFLERQRQAYATHEPGTGTWFLSHQKYQSWKNSRAPSNLICKGPPGTGKTVLTSLVVDDLTKFQSDEDIQLAYLFCQYKHQVDETIPILFLSLLRQLLMPNRIMFPFIRDKCLELFEKPCVAQELQKELIKLVKILSGGRRRTYIIVDALDEVLENDSNGKDVRNEFLRGLFLLSAQCRLFITSRPHINLEKFTATGTTLDIRAKHEDLLAYCASTIESSRVLREFCERRPGLRKEIICTVQAKANGVFLLANRHMRRIVSAISTKDLQEILRNLSTNLDEVWGFCMERLDCQSPNRSALAKKAICWVTSALRPLTDEELTQALSYVPGDTDVDLTGSIDVSLLIEVCDGMLHLEPPTVTSTSTRPVISFTHASVADYISENVTIKAAHSDLANTCLGYLSLEDLKADDIQLNRHARYHFLDYAMTHWANHASRSGEEIKLTCLLKFARKSPSALFEAAKWGLDDALHYLLENSISPNRCHQTQRPLTVAAIYGRLLCVSYLVEAGADVNYAGDEDEVQDTALSHASRAGHSQVVLLLIDSDADLNAGSVPPLFAAVFERRGPIVRQLLSAGCDPNVRHNGETAIMAAVGSNLIDIAEMLMYGGADLNARYGTGGETILSTALWSRSWNFAIKLIGNGAAVTDRSALARALKYGAYEGAEGIVQAVLRFAKPGLSPLTDAEAESKTALEPASAHAHKTALHLALEGRHHDVASHLIDNGLGINQLCGNPPYTPLEWAAGRSEVSLVQQLIAAGADPNHGGQNSPLMSAVSRFVPADNFGDPCSTEVIALLLDAGADPHSRGVKESKDLMVRIDENIQYRWWRRQDPTLRRLQVTLQLQDDWVVP